VSVEGWSLIFNWRVRPFNSETGKRHSVVIPMFVCAGVWCCNITWRV